MAKNNAINVAVPFARLTAMPLRKNRTDLGFDRGKIKIRGDITGPATSASDWSALRDDPGAGS